MRIMLISAFLSFSALAQDLTKDPSYQIDKKYCAQGIKTACDRQKCMDNPSKCDPDKINKPTPEILKEQKRIQDEMLKCKTDQACIRKFIEKESKETSTKEAADCEKGSQEACYEKELTDALYQD